MIYLIIDSPKDDETEKYWKCSANRFDTIYFSIGETPTVAKLSMIKIRVNLIIAFPFPTYSLYYDFGNRCEYATW